LTIATGNKTGSEIISGTRRRRQQTATTKNRGKWLSTPLPHKALLDSSPIIYKSATDHALSEFPEIPQIIIFYH